MFVSHFRGGLSSFVLLKKTTSRQKKLLCTSLYFLQGPWGFSGNLRKHMGLVQGQSIGIKTGTGIILRCAYLWSSFHMYSFFRKRVFNYVDGPFWNVRKESFGLTPSTWSQVSSFLFFYFFFTINILLINWPFYGELVWKLKVIAFSCTEIFISFGFLFYFGLQRRETRHSLTIC